MKMLTNKLPVANCMSPKYPSGAGNATAGFEELGPHGKCSLHLQRLSKNNKNVLVEVDLCQPVHQTTYKHALAVIYSSCLALLSHKSKFVRRRRQCYTEPGLSTRRRAVNIIVIGVPGSSAYKF